MPEQKMLLAQLDRYWECFGCGRVIDDPATAKDLEKAGMGWGVGIACPKCGLTATKTAFPGRRFRPLFEMVVECFQLKRAILVLILAQTVFEAMLGDLIAGLLFRRDCPDDILFGITNALRDLDTTERLIKGIAQKEISKLFKEVGFESIRARFGRIQSKRNKFLHSAEQKKELTIDDMREALDFAYDTVDAFAALYSEHPELRPVDQTQEQYEEY